MTILVILAFVVGAAALGAVVYELVRRIRATRITNRMKAICQKAMEGEMTEFGKLLRLAGIARNTYEKIASKCGYKPDLGGLCYDASCFLRRLAKAHEIPTEMGQGKGHWFVIYVHEGVDMVVDVTSTQFGVEDRIAVLPLFEAMKRGDWWNLQGRRSGISEHSWMTEDEDKAMEEAFGSGIGEGEL